MAALAAFKAPSDSASSSRRSVAPTITQEDPDETGKLPPLSDTTYWNKICKWCLRPRKSLNRMKHGFATRVYLVWKREAGDECYPCSSYIRMAYPSQTQTAQLAKDLEASEDSRVTYNEGVDNYIELYNSSPTGRVTKSSINKDLMVQVVNSHCFKMTENCGVWFPLKLAEEVLKRPIQQKDITHIGGDDATPKRAAVVLDEKMYGCPVGCVRLGRYTDSKVQKIEGLGSEGSELRQGQTRAAFTEAVAAGSVKVTKRKGQDSSGADASVHTVQLAKTPKKSRSKLDLSEDDSEVDFVSVAPAIGSGARDEDIEGGADAGGDQGDPRTASASKSVVRARKTRKEPRTTPKASKPRQSVTSLSTNAGVRRNLPKLAATRSRDMVAIAAVLTQVDDVVQRAQRAH